MFQGEKCKIIAKYTSLNNTRAIYFLPQTILKFLILSCMKIQIIINFNSMLG